MPVGKDPALASCPIDRHGVRRRAVGVAMDHVLTVMREKRCSDRFFVHIHDLHRVDLFRCFAVLTHLRNDGLAFGERLGQKRLLPDRIPDLRPEVLIGAIVSAQGVAVKQ